MYVKIYQIYSNINQIYFCNQQKMKESKVEILGSNQNTWLCFSAYALYWSIFRTTSAFMCWSLKNKQN